MQRNHGGNIYPYMQAHAGERPLDLSANINPFGMPHCVHEAMKCAVQDSVHYPDPYCIALREAIAQREAVLPQDIYCGNGAVDVLFRFARAVKPQRVLLTAPTFSEYETSLCASDLRFHMLRRQEDFMVTPRILQDITAEIDAVYLCNPNNPTGQVIDAVLLRDIATLCHQKGIWLLLDECFLDFLVDGDQHTLKDLLETQPKLILLRAFTKMYAMAGIRLGYCISKNYDLIERLQQAGPPWNVSVIAQAGGIAACTQIEFVQQTAQFIQQERQWMCQNLRVRGVDMVTGQANFLFWHTPDTTLHERLAKQGILIRSCAYERGLMAGDYRIAVRQRAENERFLHALDLEWRK